MQVINCRRLNKKETSLHVPAKLAGRRIHALVDTGATNQFVVTKLIQRLGLMGRVQATSVQVRLADGSIHSLDREIQLDVEMNGKIIPMSAYLLAGKGASFVLGYPVFWAND